jgi:hypothetical protein
MEDMMNAQKLTSAAVVLGLLTASSAFAGEGLGVGIVTGDTNGITLKIPAAGTSAVDLSAGVDSNADEARLRADWQQPVVIFGNSHVVVPLFVGLGGFIESSDFGVRTPFGAAFQLQRTPIEIFAQTGLEAVVVDSNNNSPSLGVSGALGVRVYGF